ncbi:hypothetical protein BCR44DRAFT_47370 [Catenaria anguillulae PL171]|uniref:Uncharacterized protein n=1 Tax=Catenaria anguillulae PL171 TaxID=765915 RepID=A0A1Y2HU93_9FUNG|nr:hypothetical protein BCR44DRAFT_47370 [Catenaria anguillulae PL171]
MKRHDRQNAPALPSELIELLLTSLLRKPKLDCLREPEPIVRVLKVVSRHGMPALTKQLLWEFARIDMDLASRIGDLDAQVHAQLEQAAAWPPGAVYSKGHHDDDAVDEASAQGHVDVFAWWLKSGVIFNYSESAMDGASGTLLY